MAKPKILLILALVVSLFCSFMVPAFASESETISEDLPMFSPGDAVDPPYTLSNEEVLYRDFYYTLTADQRAYVVTGIVDGWMLTEVAAYVNGLPVIAVHEDAFQMSELDYITFLGPIPYIHPNAFDGCAISYFVFYVQPDASVLANAPWGSTVAKPEYWVGGLCYRPHNSSTQHRYVLYSYMTEDDMLPDVPYPIDFTHLQVVSHFGAMPVYEINEATFAGFTEMQSIVFPASVKTIEGNAFSSCTSLKTVTFEGKPSKITATAFTGCTSLSKVFCNFKKGSPSGAPWGAPETTEFIYDYRSSSHFLSAMLSVFSVVGVSLIGFFSSCLSIFYVAETGLTTIGILTCCGLGVGLILLVIAFVRKFFHWR